MAIGEQQFGRDFKLVVAGKEISTRYQDASGDRSQRQFDEQVQLLRVDFAVDLTPSRDPNTANLKIYNLSEDTRAIIQAKDAPISLSCGYVNNALEIFTGEISKVSHEKTGADWVTSIDAEDGRKAATGSRINKTLTGRVSLKKAIDEVRKCAGLGIGNIKEALSEVTRKGVSGEFAFENGITLSGKCSDQLEVLFKNAGMQWSIQSGQVVALNNSNKSEARVVDINRSSGMIGEPAVGEDGKLVVTALLQGKIRPGVDFVLKSRVTNGRYRADKVKHHGSTFGKDFYTTIESRTR